MGNKPRDNPKTCAVCGSIFMGFRKTYENRNICCSLSCASRRRTIRPESERFWEKVEKTETCWNWTASKIGEYGCFRNGQVAHRVSWEINVGPIPKGMHVCHHCDNPKCIRPDHLFLGNPQTNTDDKVRKKRQAKHKLTEEKVADIRTMLSEGWFQYEIAKKYGVCQQLISNIANRKIWNHTN